MNWLVTHQYDSRGASLADKHYSRQTKGSKKFAPPGRKLVLITSDGSAVWVTLCPEAQYVHREYADAWICTIFRRAEHCPIKASQLIKEAIAVTLWKYGTPPESGMITMVDPGKVQSETNHIPGYCFKRAKFKHIGETKRKKLLILQIKPARMPEPAAPIGALWEVST
jgi:hypothetical protein